MEKPRRNYRDREGRDEGYTPRKKACRFCVDKELRIDYKDGKALRHYLSDREKISPRRFTGLCSFHQSALTIAVKRARILGLIPFSVSQRQSV